MSLLKKTIKGVQELQRYYRSGLIGYSRVDNKFIPFTNSFSLFPHPDFSSVQVSGFQSVKDASLKIEKDNALLYLSVLRIIRPSDTVTIAKLIDDFFDDDLNFINEKQKTLAYDLMLELEEFLEEENVTKHELLDLCYSFYNDNRNSFSSTLTTYNIEGLIFNPDEKSEGQNKKRYIHWKLEKDKIMSKDSLKRNTTTPVESKSISNAISEFNYLEDLNRQFLDSLDEFKREEVKKKEIEDYICEMKDHQKQVNDISNQVLMNKKGV